MPATTQSQPSGFDRFLDWSASHPREALQLSVFLFLAVWLTPICLLSLAVFLLCVRLLRLSWRVLLGSGVLVFAVCFYLEHVDHGLRLSAADWLSEGFSMNQDFWSLVIRHGEVGQFMRDLYQYGLDYLFGLPLLATGICSALELIPNSAHERQLRALQRGKKTASTNIKGSAIEKTLSRLDDSEHDVTVLGVSTSTNQGIGLSDEVVNQLVLVLGTTGAGKTITLRRFYQRAMNKGYPLMIVDGKPTDDNIAWIAEKAAQAGKPFYGFNCGNHAHYDPLAEGGYTELKDKIISLKDQWESDYYRSIAENYLQTTFEVMLVSGEAVTLKRVVELLDYGQLALLTRQLKNERLEARVSQLANYERKDITGLQAHLSLLVHSELGEYFERLEGNTFSLRDVIQQNAVVYFALPALTFPSFAAVLGKLIINDIKAVIGKSSGGKRIFTVFDEFSIFAGEQVLNLVNMGRGKGIHAVFGTQGLADLQKIHPTFANQVLNCINTMICHRLNDQESAELVSGWAGTRETFDLTAQVDLSAGGTGLGSVRRNKEFIVHPDAIKQELGTGEAFLICKAGKFRSEKIKIKYS